jgi:hypothetical protein
MGLADILTGDVFDRLAYAPHNMSKVRLFYGVPPVPISGLYYVWAKHDNPQTVLKMGLDSKGRFIPNKNQSGTIEFALIDGSVSNGIFQLAILTGIPFPIVSYDTQSAGTSFVAAGAAKRVATPEWRKEKAIGMQIYTFKTQVLITSTGIKKPE